MQCMDKPNDSNKYLHVVYRENCMAVLKYQLYVVDEITYLGGKLRALASSNNYDKKATVSQCLLLHSTIHFQHVIYRGAISLKYIV